MKLKHKGKCEFCGKEYFGIGSRFCSYSCSNKSMGQERRNKEICQICHKNFFSLPSSHRKFCSPKCFAIDLKLKWKEKTFRENRLMKRTYRISRPQKEMIDLLQSKFGVPVISEKSIKTKDKIYYADAAWVEGKIDFEYDGKYWHQFKNDDKRDLDLANEGWKVIHIYEGLDIENSLVMNLEGLI